MDRRSGRVHLIGVVALATVLLVAQLGGLYLTKHAALERDYLHLPPRWFEVLHEPHATPALAIPAGGAASAAWPLPIATMRYVTQPGDNLSTVARRFGLTLDTVSSLNRDDGSGVHIVELGEEIAIPNQEGLFLRVDGRDHLERLAAEHALSGGDVLVANPHADAGSASGLLFFPGAQHSGWERSLMMGLAFRRPLEGGWVSSGFGPRIDPFSSARSIHRGIDIAAPTGTSVVAAADAVVERVATHRVLGTYLILDHFGRSYQTLYAHLSAVHVRVGQRVRGGSAIGRVGSTGMSTGSHLHFELWHRRQPMNPELRIEGLR